MIIESCIIDSSTVMVFRMQTGSLFDINDCKTDSGYNSCTYKTSQISKNKIESYIADKACHKSAGSKINEFPPNPHEF